MGYLPERFDAINFLSLFHKLFAICNSKTQFNSSNQLGNTRYLVATGKNIFHNVLTGWNHGLHVPALH